MGFFRVAEDPRAAAAAQDLAGGGRIIVVHGGGRGGTRVVEGPAVRVAVARLLPQCRDSPHHRRHTAQPHRRKDSLDRRQRHRRPRRAVGLVRLPLGWRGPSTLIMTLRVVHGLG